MRVLDLATRIAPFDDPVGVLPLLGDTFAGLQSAAVVSAGVDPTRITAADYAFASAPLIRAFAESHSSGVGALALPRSAPSAGLTPASSVREVGELLVYDVFIDAPQDASLDALRRDATPVLVDRPWSFRRREVLRVGPPPHHLDIPDDGVVAAHVEHWVHVLWLAPLLVPAFVQHLGGKRRRSKRGLAPSWIGKDTKIHPSAHLEGAIIGDGARLGAGCSVRHSYLGADSHLSDFTKVTHSVLGEQTHTLVDATFSNVVSLGRGTLANLLLRDTILGNNVFLTSGVIFWNESIDGTVHITKEGERIDSLRKTLGGCAGHGCVLGARTIVAPGQALPNETTVVMRREEGVLRVEDADAGTPMCWYDAALVPAAKLLPDGVTEFDEID